MDEELTSVSFKDTAFLQAFGLHELNIIEYFSKSQFYDVSCIDEQLKMQARFNDLQMTSLFYLNKAFDIGMEDSKFHPLQGYRWISDEPAIKKARKELIEAANTNDKNATLTSVNDQRIALEFQNQMDKIIVDTFKVEAVKEVETPPQVVTPPDETPTETKVKRKKKELTSSKKKKEAIAPK
ncbi:hypothetical protein HDV01_000655 [Terramyces sp. JEL0728]|nr:hypothetical protein HDV01_000655 [Terramyces sp. JEL0728]